MFKTRLREIRKERGFSQKDLAERLGIGQTTIANYEKGIRQPNHKLLKSMASVLETTTDYLLGNEESLEEKAIDSDYLKRAYLTFLLDGKEMEAIDLIEGFVYNQSSAVKIIEEVIVMTQYDVGELWYNGVIDVAREHYITGVNVKMISRISRYLEVPMVQEETAVCLTSYNERHTFGLQIVAEYLKTFGYKTYYLGGGVPIQSIHKIIEDVRPSLIAVSITMPEYFEEMSHLIQTIRETHHYDYKIVIGGQERESLGLMNQVDGFAYDYYTLKTFIEGL